MRDGCWSDISRWNLINKDNMVFFGKHFVPCLQYVLCLYRNNFSADLWLPIVYVRKSCFAGPFINPERFRQIPNRYCFLANLIAFPYDCLKGRIYCQRWRCEWDDTEIISRTRKNILQWWDIISFSAFSFFMYCLQQNVLAKQWSPVIKETEWKYFLLFLL